MAHEHILDVSPVKNSMTFSGILLRLMCVLLLCACLAVVAMSVVK